jgi:hypothetical protein
VDWVHLALNGASWLMPGHEEGSSPMHSVLVSNRTREYHLTWYIATVHSMGSVFVHPVSTVDLSRSSVYFPNGYGAIITEFV